MTFEQEVESRIDKYKDRDHGYDKDGNLIYQVGMNGSTYWSEYDANNRKIHYKDSHGYEYWSKYDDKGNNIHYKDSYGIERWFEYNDRGEMIYNATNDIGDFKVFRPLTSNIDGDNRRVVKMDER